MDTLKTLYIAGPDGTGDFNCDGKDDQVQINQAFLKLDGINYDSIHLKGPFTYSISDQILTTNSFVWSGDSDAVLTVDTNRLWAATIPLIRQRAAKDSGEDYKKISGFTIDGNADAITKKYAASKGKTDLRGDGLYNLIDLYYGTIKVSNMTLKNSLNDGLITRYANTIFQNNVVSDLGHEALFAKKGYSVIFAGNTVKTMTNSACRIQDSNHVKINGNEIYTVFGPDAGGPGIQIERNGKTMNDLEIYDNYIHDTYGPGIWIITIGPPYPKTEACGIRIHDNIFKDCGTHPSYNWLGGIVLSGFYDTLIENNVFDGNYGGGFVYMYPNDSRFSGLAPAGTTKPYVTYVKGNQFFNTRLRKGTCGGIIGADPKTTGQGIINYCPNSARIVSDGNYIWDNVGGAYFNAASDTDIYHAPDEQEEEPVTVLCPACHGESWKLTEFKDKITINCSGCGEEFISP